ncbi:MAG: integrin alpha [Phycisphaerae bacterium]
MNVRHGASTVRALRCGLTALACASCWVLVAGCGVASQNDGTAGNGSIANDNGAVDPGAVSAEIFNPIINFRTSTFDGPVAVQFAVTGTPDSVSGFWVEVASGGGGPVGTPVIVAPDLAADAVFFNFDPSTVDPGFYQLGLILTVGGEEIQVLSPGTIEVEGPPSPTFILPVQPLTDIVAGASVLVSFDAGDPENNVAWRLFYLITDSPTVPDSDLTVPIGQRGTELAVSQGTDNFGSFTWATDGLAAGTYELCVSATDSGASVAATSLAGQSASIVTVHGPVVVITEPVPAPMPPTIVVTSPGTDVGLFGDEGFTIQYRGTVFEAGTVGSVTVFTDTNRDETDGFDIITADLPATGDLESIPLPAGLPEAVYNIGASITAGTDVVFAYAPGSISIVRTATLNVTAPTSTLPVGPSDPVTVSWTTNVPPGPGRSVDVFARTVDASGAAFGPEIPVLSPTGTGTTSATFASADSGIFEISVRLTFTDTTPDLVKTAPTPVRVSSLPAVLWLGSLANTTSDGAIFEGVNFEDNAGTSFANVGDVDADGLDDFVINARYGKPFFTNPIGVGPGEAYLIYGASGATKLLGGFNLNSVGTAGLRGVLFTGIRTPQASNDTDGLTAVTRLPDLDNDGRGELMFGFPNTDSRGHNVDFRQDGVMDEELLCTLEEHDQFLRGGVVIVSSQNPILSDPTAGSPVINLDLVGQVFPITVPQPEPGEDWFSDQHDGVEPGITCELDCPAGASDGIFDTVFGTTMGFVEELAGDYITTFVLNGCADPGFYPLTLCTPLLRFCPPAGLSVTEPASPLLTLGAGLTGFYPTMYPNPDPNADDEFLMNDPLPPFGARIIGIGLGDAFGTSVTLSESGGGTADVIVSAPNRTARGILFGPDSGDPNNGGEVDGLADPPNNPVERNNSGVAYLFPLRDLWDPDAAGRIPPKPHQYMVGQPSHVSGGLGGTRIPNIDAIRVAGQTNEAIKNIIGIEDFNADGRSDFAVGAPDAAGGQGRVYIAFRRDPAVEGDYVLEKLAFDPSDADRLEGVLVVSNSPSRLGASLATGVDFNGDGVSDLVIGSPNAGAGSGEVIIVFGDPTLTSPVGGITAQELLLANPTTGQPRAARITGSTLDVNGQFGFNVANAGDIDGDGTNDLLIAAPNATPRFDPDPTDGVDALTDPGLDLDFNGQQDDVSGPFGIPDLAIDSFDDLANAGLVYVIFGSNRLDQVGSVSVDQLGTNQLRGFMIAGRRAGDRIGGGDAGDANAGGSIEKVGRGRSQGLASAGDVDGDGRDDILIGSVLADPRVDPANGNGTQNGGEAYLIYGAVTPGG